MDPVLCVDCKELCSRGLNKKHPCLKRVGRARAVGFHGARDDEYKYICEICGATYHGDSFGIWRAASDESP